MNRTVLTILIFVFLLLFIISPFAGLANLLLVLLFAALFFLISNLFQALIGSKTDSHS